MSMIGTHRTLIVDPSEPMRAWLRCALGPRAGQVTEVQAGWEALASVAGQRFSLVVASGDLAGISGAELLTMMRSAGLKVPYLLIQAGCPPAVRDMVERIGDAHVLADWRDAATLRTWAGWLQDRQLGGLLAPRALGRPGPPPPVPSAA
jgi:CheY-like chemotaxis protein